MERNRHVPPQRSAGERAHRGELRSSPFNLEMPAGGELLVGGIDTNHYSERVNVSLIKERIVNELRSSPSVLEMPAGGELVVGGNGTNRYSELVNGPMSNRVHVLAVRLEPST